ncbi:hypothetical protein CBF30_10565 [Vagococcus entomophilus]|uniref:Uncharacterized protein n=2 Tax=Vagococcus entomophilus TaxID=1160095 RepID=A0A430AFA6_9ENTE|nr:hypothetical protein CBF30_10565 [Vagococcus entomophilus]
MMTVLVGCSGQREKDSLKKQLSSTEMTSLTIEKHENSLLSPYTDEQIEYASVWLSLGVNQQIDELNVLRIPAGTLINPNDTSSAVYPVNTIQLCGSRLIDASVTYSRNNDGTITVYNVPQRWEANLPEGLDKNYMKQYTQSLIDNGQIKRVEMGAPENIIKLINIQIIH